MESGINSGINVIQLWCHQLSQSVRQASCFLSLSCIEALLGSEVFGAGKANRSVGSLPLDRTELVYGSCWPSKADMQLTGTGTVQKGAVIDLDGSGSIGGYGAEG